jgi:hypothetical protein
MNIPYPTYKNEAYFSKEYTSIPDLSDRHEFVFESDWSEALEIIKLGVSVFRSIALGFIDMMAESIIISQENKALAKSDEDDY